MAIAREMKTRARGKRARGEIALEKRILIRRKPIVWYAAWWLTLGILSLCCSHAYSQGITDPIPTSPPVPVGSGARALGMGGAFIAVADDATAASWNPGGLGQLQRREMSVVGSWFSRSEHYDSSLENDSGSRSSSSDLNYLSYAYARNIWRRNMFFSLNYQKMFDFGRRVKFEVPPVFDSQSGTSITERNDFQQEGSLYAFSPAISLEVVPGFYAGLAYNAWSNSITGKSQWESKNQRIFSTGKDEARVKYKDFQGENWTLGFLWKITQQLHLGGVCKTPFQAKVKGELHSLYADQDKEKVKEEIYRIDFPLAYGVGLSYRLGNSLTFAGDVTRTEWQDFIISDDSGKIGPFQIFKGDVPHKDPTYTGRLGAEYAYVLDNLGIVLPFRVGVFYDPEPSVKAPQDFYGMSLGCGIAGKRLALDFAYQFRTGPPVNSVELGFDKGQKSNEGKIQQHFLLSSLIFYF